jgi:hypothetical protein
MTTVSLTTAILFLPLPVVFGVILVRRIGTFTPENRGIEVEILRLSGLQAKISLEEKLPPPN